MNTDKAYLNELWRKIHEYDDTSSYADLFHLCYQRLVRFGTDFVQHREAAEDIVSDIFLKLWTDRAQYRDIRHIEKYLFTAVRNRSINYLRQYSTLRVVSAGDDEELQIAHSSDPYKASEWKELLARLDEAVALLPPERRKIFRLVREEGFKTREVAEILQLSPRTVETQLYKAVKTLHAVLLPYLDARHTSGAAGKPDPAALLGFLLALLFL
ncbi:RNA polymerase sigma-70 factor [Chitinophaga lutea]